MKTLVSSVLALGMMAGIAGQAFAENDSTRDPRNAKEFYQQQELQKN